MAIEKMKWHKSLVATGICSLLLSAFSCVDNDYDLDGMSLEINVGGSDLALPIGRTEQVKVSKLLKLNEGGMVRIVNGKYVIVKDSVLTIDVPQIKPLTIDVETHINPVFFWEAISQNRSVGEVIEVDTHTPGSFRFQTDIDAEDVTLREVTRLELRETVQSRLSFVLTDVPAEVTNVTFSDYAVTFPGFLEFDEEAQVTDHTLILNESLTRTGNGQWSLEILLPVRNLDFSDGQRDIITNEGRTIRVEEEFTLSGKIGFTGTGLQAGTLANVVMQPAFAVPGMTVEIIDGLIDPVIAVDDQVFNMDLPEFLKEDGVVMDLENPRMSVQLENPFGMPFRTNLVLTSFRSGVEINTPVTVSGMKIKEAVNLFRPEESLFWIADSDAGIEPGYTLYRPDNGENLAAFLNGQVPEEIRLSLPRTEADMSRPHRLLLTDDNRRPIDLNYSLYAPLKFGDKFKIQYNDTTDNLQKDLEDILDKVSEIIVVAEVKSTIPLNLHAKGVAAGMNKNVLPGISVEVLAMDTDDEGVIKGSRDGAVTESEIRIRVKEIVAGELEKLDALIVTVYGNASDTSGQTLDENQYFQMMMKVRIPGGISVDLDD